MWREAAAILLVLALLAVFVFPIGSAGSSVFYITVCFVSISLFTASLGRELSAGLKCLWLAPKKKDILPLMVQSAALFFACAIITVSITGICYALGILDTQNVYDKVVALPVPVLIAAFAIAPIGEEMLFRGLLFRKIGEWLGGRDGKAAAWLPWALAAIASSAIFSVLHASYGSIAELLVAFAIGIALCIGTLRFRSLVPAVMAHAAFNFVSVFMAVFL